ncbi:hypothetical protein, partial [Agromyces binzhouensis]|uniref:hypothetical protein n=1 Tax=Agromyces binzhouensis TaxID=1817495 RepID=UPI0013EBE42B
TAASVGVGAIAGAFAARARSRQGVDDEEPPGEPLWADPAPDEHASSDDVQTAEIEGLTRGSRGR